MCHVCVTPVSRLCHTSSWSGLGCVLLMSLDIFFQDVSSISSSATRRVLVVPFFLHETPVAAMEPKVAVESEVKHKVATFRQVSTSAVLKMSANSVF